jgi:hypothetical protein
VVGAHSLGNPVTYATGAFLTEILSVDLDKPGADLAYYAPGAYMTGFSGRLEGSAQISRMATIAGSSSAARSCATVALCVIVADQRSPGASRTGHDRSSAPPW